MSDYETIKSRILELQTQREALEMEADAIVSELTAPGPNGEKPIGIKDPLVDREGFPRSDIDIYRARTRRGRLAVISNDHKHIMQEIERELSKLHSTFDKPVFGQVEEQHNEVQRRSEVHPVAVAVEEDYRSYKPMALIDEVLEDSPAQLSGLRVGDKLVCFGPVNTLSSPNPLSLVPEVVRDFHGSRSPAPAPPAHTTAAAPAPVPAAHIPVVVLRAQGELVRVQLVPRVWSGRGLLGCHLTPL